MAALPDGPTFPARRGATRDRRFTEAQWTNGRSGTGANITYQNNARGPWQLQDRSVIAPWGARVVPPGWNYFLRPSLLRVQATWPAIPLQLRQTRFHLRQTKYIDHPCNAIVIQTDATMLPNNASHYVNEWTEKGDGRALPNPTTTYIGLLVAPLPDLATLILPRMFLSIPIDVYTC